MKVSFAFFQLLDWYLIAPPPPELERARTDPAARLKSVNAETKVILAQLERDYKAPEEAVAVKKVADSINAVNILSYYNHDNFITYHLLWHC